MPIPAASRAFAALAVAVAVRAVRPKDLESEREEIFQQLYRRYFAHYDQGLARSMLGLLPHEIPMQFEFEVPRPLYYMNMPPELLLMRGGINSPSFAPGEAFQSDSPWWLVEIDGLGSKHHQVLQGLPEANSVVVRPKTVLNSSLPDDLVGYLDKLKVPREQHKGSFQFTVGVSAAQVPQLLRRTPPLRRRQEQTAEYCRTRHPPCSQQYEGLLLLAGMVLEQAAACPSCGFPKRCQSPWLLRTHVGDLVQTLPEEEQQSLVDDALQLWNGHPDVPLYPKGIMDYLHFPEMAEIGGMVKTRLDDASSAREEMPLEMAGLLQLASRMLREREEVDQRLRGRRCEVNGYGGSWQVPSGRQWLLAAQEGRDLMSDHDSPISKASLSSTVWRSMGKWRHSTEEPRIFLDCRAPKTCLGVRSEKWRQLSRDLMSDHDSPISKASLSSTVWRSMGKWRHSTEEPRIFLECRAPKTCLGVRSEKWRQLSYQAMLEEAARVAHELETSPA